MPESVAIIGLNYGDEGKGLMTDYFCREMTSDVDSTPHDGLCVRFNGGAQAGHTVVTPEGQSHVFHHFGSGSFAGVPTFLSKFFLVNPVLFVQEKILAEKRGIKLPVVFIDPRCQVTTPWDMLLNQARERARGKAGAHGSCGVGIGTTMERVEQAMGLGFMSKMVKSQVLEVRDYCYQTLVLEGLSEDRAFVNFFLSDEVYEAYLAAAQYTSQYSRYLDGGAALGQAEFLVFEGAQGLRLDMDNKEEFPHVTYSKTGKDNVLDLCEEADIEDPRFVFVSRVYNTRHGNGPFREWDRNDWAHTCPTNVGHEFQGVMRYGPLDLDWISNHVDLDELAITHMDQMPIGGIDVSYQNQVINLNRYQIYDILNQSYESYGPTHEDVVDLGF